MSIPATVHRSPAALLLLPLALTACGPSEEEIHTMVDARVGALQQRLEAEKVIKTDAELEKQKAEEAAKTEWEKSLDVLAALDKLMADYTPTLPVAKDNTDVLRCTTSDELSSNTTLAGAASGLAKQKAASEQARRAAAAAFEKGKWGEFAVDEDWKAHVVQYPAVYGCSLVYGDGEVGWPPGILTPDDCKQAAGYSGLPYTWKVRTPAREDTFLHTGLPVSSGDGMPKLMKRIEASKFEIPARFSCRIDQVTRANDGARTVNCAGSGDSAGAYIKLSASATAPAYHIGDVVSVPLKDTKRDPSGVLFKEVRDNGDHWVVSADPASVTIDVPATCPTVDEIVAATAAK